MLVGTDKLELDFVLVLPAEKNFRKVNHSETSESCCTHSLILAAYLPAVRNVIPGGTGSDHSSSALLYIHCL